MTDIKLYDNQVWVEKYRPKQFENIVLDKYNKIIMNNIINQNYFPNILLYGPPGTGKTTTIVNIINSYHKNKYPNNNQNNHCQIIHLNASDERGIDIIRNQIYQFVNSRSLFNNSMKFVILDEVDYMTKNAQIALKYLLQSFNQSCSFCLICNYISRVDDSLKNDFIQFKFNKLPKEDVTRCLQNIVNKENLSITDDTLSDIQYIYKSDIRSMINHIQLNQNFLKNKIISSELWNNITFILKDKHNYHLIYEKINEISIEYNIDIRNIIKDYLNFLIRNHDYLLTSKNFVVFLENVIHSNDTNIDYIKKYTFEHLHSIFLSTDT